MPVLSIAIVLSSASTTIIVIAIITIIPVRTLVLILILVATISTYSVKIWITAFLTGAIASFIKIFEYYSRYL